MYVITAANYQKSWRRSREIIPNRMYYISTVWIAGRRGRGEMYFISTAWNAGGERQGRNFTVNSLRKNYTVSVWNWSRCYCRHHFPENDFLLAWMKRKKKSLKVWGKWKDSYVNELIHTPLPIFTLTDIENPAEWPGWSFVWNCPFQPRTQGFSLTKWKGQTWGRGCVCAHCSWKEERFPRPPFAYKPNKRPLQDQIRKLVTPG